MSVWAEGEPEEDGYEDQYQLEDADVTAADYIVPVAVSNWRYALSGNCAGAYTSSCPPLPYVPGLISQACVVLSHAGPCILGITSCCQPDCVLASAADSPDVTGRQCALCARA